MAVSSANQLTSAQQAICNAVERGFDKQVAFTQALITVPSLRGDESAAQRLMAAAMSERGLDVDTWNLDPVGLADHPGAGTIEVDYDQAVNVVGSYVPRTHVGRSLILNGHIDVVPNGTESLWSRSPWDAAVIDGWLYGRGSGDMKAGLAANLFALDAIRDAGFRPTAPIQVQSVVEEESTGNGTLSAFLRGYTADAAIFTEPTNGTLVRANAGVIWMRVIVTGKGAHAYQMASGINAIDAAFLTIGALRELEDDWNGRLSTEPYFCELEHPLNFNLGQIRGGDWPSSVADQCEYVMRIGFPPGVDVDDAWDEVREYLAGYVKSEPRLAHMNLSIERSGLFADGYALAPGSAAEDALADAHLLATGRALSAEVMSAHLDARVYALFSTTTPLVFGPVAESIHGSDERVELESLRSVTRTIALFIAEWCGLEQDAPAAP